MLQNSNTEKSGNPLYNLDFRKFIVFIIQNILLQQARSRPKKFLSFCNAM